MSDERLMGWAQWHQHGCGPVANQGGQPRPALRRGESHSQPSGDTAPGFSSATAIERSPRLAAHGLSERWLAAGVRTAHHVPVKLPIFFCVWPWVRSTTNGE
jgi:hypothetical protein